MPVAISGGTRLKATTTDSLNPSILAPTPTLDDSGDSIIQYIQLENITPNPSTFTCAATTTTNSSTAISGANLTNVRVGDGITGTGIQGGTTIATKPTATTATLSQAATASGSVTVTITPPVLDANLIAIKTTMSQSGSELSFAISVYKADGTTAKGTTVDTSTYADYTEVAAQRRTVTIDLDTFLTNARVARG
jgi:hypothetical protein